MTAGSNTNSPSDAAPSEQKGDGGLGGLGGSSGELSGRVLLVDDDDGIRRLVARWLTRDGLNVEVASDGALAIELLRGQTFDLIVSDISMPTMDGMQLLSAVRALDRDVPVVLMTGNPGLDTAMQAIEFGVLRYLTKPVSLEQLRRVVREALEQRRLTALSAEALAQVLATDKLKDDRAELGARFTRALDSTWIAYQPIVSWPMRKVVAFEALMRPTELGMANPDALLRASEKLGRVHEIGRMVRPRSVAPLGRAVESPDLYVNLHPHDLLDDDLYDPQAPLSMVASRVVLELTERASLHEVSDVRARIASLRKLGFRVAIDDLGAGYAGLNSFALLDPEVVKIDMGLVRDVHTSSTQRSVIRGLVSLCRDLKISVIAEGVETAEERDVLVDVGVEMLQGYFFARPGVAFPVAQL